MPHHAPPHDGDGRSPNGGGTALEVAGDEASSSGHTARALECWSEALSAFGEEGQPAEAARVASKMAATEESLGEAEDAGVHYEQAVECFRRAGKMHRVPMCLNNLAMLRKLSGRLDEAAELLGDAIEEALHCHGTIHGETALLASNLGAVLCECGDLLGAEQWHMQALSVREQLFGATHPEVGLSLGHLAVIYQMRGDIERARCFYSSALAILDEFPGLHEAERTILRQNLEEL